MVPCRLDHIFSTFRTAAGRLRRMDVILVSGCLAARCCPACRCLCVFLSEWQPNSRLRCENVMLVRAWREPCRAL